MLKVLDYHSTCWPFFFGTVIKVTPVDYALTWGALSLPPRVAGPSLAPEEQKEPLPAWRFLVFANARGLFMILSMLWYYIKRKRERESVIRRYQQDRGPEGEHNNMPCSIMHMYILQNYILYTVRERERYIYCTSHWHSAFVYAAPTTVHKCKIYNIVRYEIQYIAIQHTQYIRVKCTSIARINIYFSFYNHTSHTILVLSLLHGSLSLSKATKHDLGMTFDSSEWGMTKAWVSRVHWIGHGSYKHLNRARRRKREA